MKNYVSNDKMKKKWLKWTKSCEFFLFKKSSQKILDPNKTVQDQKNPRVDQLENNKKEKSQKTEAFKNQICIWSKPYGLDSQF